MGEEFNDLFLLNYVRVTITGNRKTHHFFVQRSHKCKKAIGWIHKKWHVFDFQFMQIVNSSLTALSALAHHLQYFIAFKIWIVKTVNDSVIASSNAQFCWLITLFVFINYNDLVAEVLLANFDPTTWQDPCRFFSLSIIYVCLYLVKE